MPKRLLEQDTIEWAQAMAHLGIWRLDPGTGEISWSDEVYRLHGLEPGVPLTLDLVLDRVHPDDREQAAQVVDRLLRGEQVGRWANRIVLPDGSVRWIEFSGGLFPDGTLVGFVQDGTERCETQQRLEEERSRSDLAESIAQIGSWMLDVRTGAMQWSSQLYRLLDLDPATFTPTKETAFALAEPEDRSIGEAFIARVLRGEDPGMINIRLRGDDGRFRWFEARAERVREGVIVGFFQDVTERRAAADQLLLQSRILAEMTECVMLTRANDWRILWANPQAAAELGLTMDELLSKRGDELTAPDQMGVLEDAWNHLVTDGSWYGEIARVRPDGSEFLTEARIATMDHPDHGQVWLTVSHDIEDRKARERALHESEMRLRAVQDNAPTGIATVDLDGRWLYVNDAVCALFGRSRAELEHTYIRDVTHPDEIENALALARDLREGRRLRTQSERRFLGADGTVVWVLITASLVRDPEGEPRFYVVHLVDITERKAEEDLRRRQAVELERANRAKTEFLSRMSHELRTPLNAVLGFGQLLADADLPAQDQRAVEQILYAGRHLLGLINEVLDITRVESGTLDLRLEPVEVADVIAEAVALVRPEAARSGVTITVADEGRGRLILSDRRRVVQVLLNLLSNAIKYNRPGGVVAISSEAGAGGVHIAVADSGRGIPAESLPRLFEPFDRLGIEREGIEGTGIGLPLARGLVHEMGGTITVESEVGRGSTFTIELPATDGLPATPGGTRRERAAASPPVGGDGRLLRIVNIEDNPANQQLIESILRKRSGVELWTAPDAVTGLDLVRRHRPGLVILDLHLPDLPGAEVLRQVRADPSGPPPVVAVCSADASPAQIEQLLHLGADHYLTKPFDIPAFLAIVDDATAACREPSTPADIVSGTA